jgi:hypothetical protein
VLASPFACKRSQKTKKIKSLLTLLFLPFLSGGSGKSTFAKQIRIISSATPFEVEELKGYKEKMRANVLLGLKELYAAAQSSGKQIRNAKVCIR